MPSELIDEYQIPYATQGCADTVRAACWMYTVGAQLAPLAVHAACRYSTPAAGSLRQPTGYRAYRHNLPIGNNESGQQ